MNGDTVLVCRRVSDRTTVAAGSMQRLCAECGAGVWVSKASLVDAHDPGEAVKIMCLPCARVAIARTSEPMEMMPPSAAQLEEVRAALLARSQAAREAVMTEFWKAGR